MEKELATKIDQVNEYSRVSFSTKKSFFVAEISYIFRDGSFQELTEKKASLTEISGRLEEAKVQVEVYKKKNEQVMNLLGNIT